MTMGLDSVVSKDFPAPGKEGLGLKCPEDVMILNGQL